MMTDRSLLEEELRVACTAVQLCASLTKRLQKETLSADSSISKSDYSPVTIADYAVQALLTSALQHAFKNDKFLAEESADQLRQNRPLLDKVMDLVNEMKPAYDSVNPPLLSPMSSSDVLDLVDQGGKNDRSDSGRTWVIDPIDGTQTFMRGQQYCINVALLAEGKQELGIIGCPNLRLDSETASEDDIDEGLGLMIFATRERGTYVRRMQEGTNLAAVTRIPRHGDNATKDKLIWSDCSTYTSTITHLQQKVAADLGTPWPGVDLYSSVLKYASLGLGRSSICMRIFKFTSWRSNRSEFALRSSEKSSLTDISWDHAGGVLIATEAGCKVTDLEGKPIDFSRGRKMADSK